jgi:uncharacterized protein (DUF2235 family)
MAKNVIFCADGTWNGAGQADDHDDDQNTDPGKRSNVFKLFANLDGADSPDTMLLANEQEKNLVAANGDVVQVAKYLHGVGDSRNVIVRGVGGSTGAGLVKRIVRGYTYISRKYVEGDHIFIVGFSRGAYTARALAGLIAARGLIDAGREDMTDKAKAYAMASAVWFAYRRDALQARGLRLDSLQEVAAELPGFLRRTELPRLIAPVPIAAVAVWDTVGALGIPKFNADQTRKDVFEFADRKLSDAVRRGLHAVSLDERRSDFTPTLWNADSRVTQELFPGAHSDVGGGYPMTECGLSDGALLWMMTRLSESGVRFAATLPFEPRPDPLAPAHEPWRDKPFLTVARSFSDPTATLTVNPSVRERMKGAGVIFDPGTPPRPYAPTNLP